MLKTGLRDKEMYKGCKRNRITDLLHPERASAQDRKVFLALKRTCCIAHKRVHVARWYVVFQAPTHRILSMMSKYGSPVPFLGGTATLTEQLKRDSANGKCGLVHLGQNTFQPYFATSSKQVFMVNPIREYFKDTLLLNHPQSEPMIQFTN